MGVIIFNGVSSLDYGIQVESPPNYEIPERNYEITPIPGRNGELTLDRGGYKNVNRSYQIAIGAVGGDFTTLANKISKWLHSGSGYARLEDSYEPDHYKLATYSEDGSISNILQQAGRLTINFNRKPQRFLKTGDTKSIITIPTTLVNPTDQSALPIITVKGSGAGVLHVGSYVVTISDIINYIDLNSDIEEAYNGIINLNGYITLSNGFPKLIPGDNLISFSGGITSVEVLPKWWTI
jgi:phage-related protein